MGIPHSGAKYPASTLHPIELMKDFWRANRLLWRDAEGGLSLGVTTIFWGLGATLQFVVLKWSADILGLPLEHSAYLQAAVAVGVVAGAGIAGRWIALRNAKRVLPAGVLMGLLIVGSAHVTQLSTALVVLTVMGAVGGILVVPLNALLQHRGFVLLTAGRSIAVQGFNENLSVLCMLGIYAGLVAAGCRWERVAGGGLEDRAQACDLATGRWRVVWEPQRVLRLADSRDVQEGQRVVFPLTLTTPGDVAGLTFRLNYDASYLADPKVELSALVGQSVNMVERVWFQTSW
jgi:MFS family permease